MAVTPSCPRCGETDDLHGRPDGEDIRLTCGRCGHAWLRGVSPCATCAGTDVVHRPQSMTRTPRGNQLAIIGTRSIALCQTCDAPVLQTSLSRNQPVPEGYVAAYRQPRDRPAPGSPSTRSAPVAPPAPAPGPRTTPRSTSRPQAGTPAGQSPRRSRPAAPATVPADPTIRQAVAAVMEERTDLDATTVLLLATHLGTTTRLSHLDDATGTAALTSWVQATWPDATSVRGRMSRATLRAVVDDWRTRGWLEHDLAAGLRAEAAP
jgi:ribosomal protein S27AE